MDVSATFKPVAKKLIDATFPTKIEYLETANPTYDPETGEVTPNVITHSINAGVLSRGRSESGGVAEEYELRLWIHHDAGGLESLPKTSDRVRYDSVTWKIVDIDPTYSSESLIASKLLLRAE